MLTRESGWEVYAELGDEVVGFVSLRLDGDTKVGEVGLNAVHPSHAGRGIGSEMYNFAVARMKEAGMKVATVSTGIQATLLRVGAYQKAGFSVEIPSVWMYRRL